MKRRLLFTVLFTGLSFLTVNAQEYWLNEDFSSQQWQDAIRGWIDETGGSLVFPEASPSNVDIADGTVINGYTINGAYIRPGEAEFSCTCADGGTAHQYGFRLRKGDISYIQLPQVANAKKISIHVRNGNANNPSSILLEEYDESDGTWKLLETLAAQPSSAYTEQDEVVEVNLNKSVPTTLRISRGGNFFVAIYEIAVEKGDGGSSVHSTLANDIDLYVNDKTVYLTGNARNACISLYDMCGRVLFESPLNGEQVKLPTSLQSGTYIVKLGTSEYLLKKKIYIQ